MFKLTDEQQKALEQALVQPEAPAPGEEPLRPESGEAQATAATGEQNAADGQQNLEQTQAKLDEQQAPATKRPVPYERFSEVIKARDTEKAAAAAAKAEVDALKTEVADLRKAQQRSRLVDSVFDDDPQEQPTQRQQQAKPERDPEFAAVQAELAEIRLERTLKIAARDYPDVPEEVVLRGINSGLELNAIADWWDEHVSLVHKHAPVARQSAEPQGQRQSQSGGTTPAGTKQPQGQQSSSSTAPQRLSSGTASSSGAKDVPGTRGLSPDQRARAAFQAWQGTQAR